MGSSTDHRPPSIEMRFDLSTGRSTSMPRETPGTSDPIARPSAGAAAAWGFLALAIWGPRAFCAPEPASRQAGDSQAEPLQARLVLAGDAGEADAAALGEVSAWASRGPDETLVVYLGDNFYPEGMTPEHRDEADRKLLPQIEAASRAGARALFVPGNHDWADGEAQGHEAILAEAAYVESHLGYPDGFLPSGGCPGPVAVDRLPGVRIVVLDTQWWLHEHEKPSGECPTAEPASFSAALSGFLDTDRAVVIVAHHPLVGFGRHAGVSDWKAYLIPPVIGTLVALDRKLRPGIQDYASEPYGAMTGLFRQALAERREDGLLVWAAGHDHSLQVLEDPSVDYVLISGSAAKTTPVGRAEELLFADEGPGFMVVDFLASGRVRLRVIEPGLGEVFGQWLEAGGPGGGGRP